MAGRFIASGRISNESSKFHDGKVTGVGILHEGSDDTTPTESPAGGTFREYLSGRMDSESANGAESVATEESQLIPPIKASASSQIIGSNNAFNARNARNARSLDDFFMV